MEDLDLLLGQPLRAALQCVVHGLRDVEELLGAADDPPLDVQADVCHQRHERVVDLGDAAAERGRGQVRDALTLQRLGERADLVHQPACGERGVVGERLAADVDDIQHEIRGTPASWRA